QTANPRIGGGLTPFRWSERTTNGRNRRLNMDSGRPAPQTATILGVLDCTRAPPGRVPIALQWAVGTLPNAAVAQKETDLTLAHPCFDSPAGYNVPLSFG